MKKEVITTAKTIEEAVALAVKELGAPNEEKIEYTVLEEPKKGLFGIGAQNAKISAGTTKAIYTLNAGIMKTMILFEQPMALSSV